MAFKKGGSYSNNTTGAAKAKGSSWLTVGEILISKAGSPYVKFKEDFEVKQGMTLTMQDPRVRLEEAVAAGRMSEDEAQERAAKIPDFLKYSLVLPPAKD